MMCGKRNDCSETLWKDDWYARIEMNTSTAEIWISNLEKYRIFSPVQNIFTPTPASLSETDILAIYGCKAASSICGRSKNKNLGLVLPSSWWDHSLRFPYEPALKWTWRSNIFSHTGRLGSLILCSSSSNHISLSQNVEIKLIECPHIEYIVFWWSHSLVGCHQVWVAEDSRMKWSLDYLSQRGTQTLMVETSGCAAGALSWTTWHSPDKHWCKIQVV